MLETPLVKYRIRSHKAPDGTSRIKLSISGQENYELNLILGTFLGLTLAAVVLFY